MTNTLFENKILLTFQSKQKQVKEHILHYQIRNGSAEPDRTFMLVHGATTTLEVLKVIATNLTEVFPESRIILLDLPWHGKSISPKEQLKETTIYGYAEIVEDFIQMLKEDNEVRGKLNWIGWGMGGSIGQILTLKSVGIDELVLLNSSPVWRSIERFKEVIPAINSKESIKGLFYQIFANSFNSHMTEVECEEVLNHYESLTSDREVMIHDLEIILPKNFDVRDDLYKIKAKTLILAGGADDFAELECQTAFGINIPQSKLIIVDDNHMMLVKEEIVKRLVDEIKEYYK